jgi:hypothetical protein
MLMAPAAAVAASSSRRLGDSDAADMMSSSGYPIYSDAGTQSDCQRRQIYWTMVFSIPLDWFATSGVFIRETDTKAQ